MTLPVPRVVSLDDPKIKRDGKKMAIMIMDTIKDPKSTLRKILKIFLSVKEIRRKI